MGEEVEVGDGECCLWGEGGGGIVAAELQEQVETFGVAALIVGVGEEEGAFDGLLFRHGHPGREDEVHLVGHAGEIADVAELAGAEKIAIGCWADELWGGEILGGGKKCAAEGCGGKKDEGGKRRFMSELGHRSEKSWRTESSLRRQPCAHGMVDDYSLSASGALSIRSRNWSSFGVMMISVRRLRWRPSSVSLSAMGLYSPRPAAVMRAGFTPKSFWST